MTFLFAPASFAYPPVGDIDPGNDGGGGTGTTTTNPGVAPGPAYSWEGSNGDVKTGNGNKLTAIPIINWTARGGLPVNITLYHNSEGTQTGRLSEVGPKWTLSYDTTLMVNANGNVTVLWGDGRFYTFTKSGTAFIPPPGINETLTQPSSTTYKLIDHNWVTYNFSSTYPAKGGYPGGNFSNGFNLVKIVDTNGNYVDVDRHYNGQIDAIYEPGHGQLNFAYDANYHLASITDPLSHQWTVDYDTNGNLYHVYYPTVGGSNYNTQFGYDTNHNITSLRDRRGKSWTFGYNTSDSSNSLAWEKTPLGNQTKYAYTATTTTITDPNNNVTTHTYDTATGHLTQEKDPLNYTENYYYDADNNINHLQDKRGFDWYATFDGSGNQLTAKDPYNKVTTSTYSTHNKLWTVALPLGRSVKNTYDASDNLTKVEEKNSGGTVVATTLYYPGTYGLLDHKTDPNSHTTYYTYTGAGDLYTVKTPLGNVRTWGRNGLGVVNSYQDALLRTTTYTLDEWNRVTAKNFPDSTQFTYTYDGENNLISNLIRGQTVQRTFDSDGRMTAEGYLNGSGVFVPTVQHTYDAAGQKGLLSTTTDGSGRGITYTYTTRNQMASAGDNTGATTYSYDAAGNRNYVGIPNGMHVNEYYDNAGRVSSYYNYVNGSSAPAQSYGYTYNDDSQITIASEGTSAAVPPAVNPVQTTYGYDAQGHLNSEARTGDGNSYSYTYVYDGAGNRKTQNIVGGGATTLTYDADDELKSTSGQYNYTYGYNANGAQTSSVMGGVTTTYSYDYEDNLTLISSSAGATGYAYDGLNRQGVRSAGGHNHYYALDGDTVLSESIDGVDGPNTLWGAGYLTRWGGEYPLVDGLGNQHLIVDSSRNLQATSTFSAFGWNSTFTGPSGNPHVYRSMPTYRADHDGPSGGGFEYYKVGCRYYDSQFGRFITRDSVLTEKPYAYCNDDPINFVDPSGHNAKSAVAAVVVGTAGVLLSVAVDVTTEGTGVASNKYIVNASVGAATGFAAGFAGAQANGSNPWSAGLEGAGIGAAGGLVTGGLTNGPLGRTMTTAAKNFFRQLMK